MAVLRCLLLWLACACAAAESAAPRVAFLAPNPPDNPFWGVLYRIMEKAARDLGIELTIHYSRGNTFSFNRDGEALLTADPKPDYFVTGYWNGVTHKHLELAERRGIKTVVINTEISREERRHCGVPRGRFSRWIAHLRPDDRAGGEDLARTLLEAARTAGVEVERAWLLGGSHDSDVSNQRERGARAALAAAGLDPGETLYAMWLEDVAEKAVHKALAAGPPPQIVWTASDTMALGAARALAAAGLTVNRDVFVGGVDWSRIGIEAVEQGRLTASYGGHFMEGAWALVLIHDYHHGRDFAEVIGTDIRTRLQAVTQANAAAYRRALDEKAWERIDFAQLSRVRHPELPGYRFHPDILLQAAGP